MKKIGDISFFDVQDVAKAFDMTPQSVRRLFKTGAIKAQKVGTRWYATEEAIRDYLEGKDNQ